ncbi:hypothetical protein VTK56DRAFT_3551 [Thermocarpiscus australiensis]
MANPYIVGDSSPFLKRVLIPFWIIRIIIMLVQIGLYGVLITGLGVLRDDVHQAYKEYNAAALGSYDAILAASVVIVVIVLVCLILDLVCIIKRARRTLSPPFFLGVNITQSVFYIINFILAMIGAGSGAVSIAINVMILLSFLGLLIYASLVYHRYRKGALRGAYAPAHNLEAHSLTAANTAYGPQTAYPPPYAPDYPKTAYYDPYAAQAYGGQGFYSPQPYAPQHQAYEMNQRPAV